jgi:hypothetical protein
MRHITWKRLGIMASVIWLVVGPTTFHLSREDNERRTAGDRYEVCIKQFGLTQGGIERCNKNLRQALVISHWSSWAQIAFIPPALAWLTAWGLSVIVRRRRRPEPGSEQPPQKAKVETATNSNENHFPAPWTVEAVLDGFKVVDANGQSLAHVYGHDPRDAGTAKALTLDEARRIAANIAKLPDLLRKGDFWR